MPNQNLPASITPPAGYYNRFDPEKRYDRNLFRADRVLQAPELNEIQDRADAQVRGIADALFKDGAIMSGCQLILTDAESDNATGASGVMYLEGAMRGIPEATFTVPMTGTVEVGIYLVYAIVTPTEDAELADPAVGLMNAGEPGAYRLSKTPQWGYDGEPDPPATAAFYPVYTVIDGVLQPKTPPPDINAISRAIARYDIQSTGSQYVANGMGVKQMPDDGDDQVYIIQEGTARINGVELTLDNSIRSYYNATPDLDSVSAESHAVSTNPQTFTLNHSPISAITLVLITRQVVDESVTRGQTPGGADGLAHDSITSITNVKQGGTTYTATADYLKSGDTVSWSPGGLEPAGGSTYTVSYQYTAVYPDEPSIVSAVTATTVTIAGAVSGSNALIGYDWKMPRYDRMCIDETGAVSFVQGVSHPYIPVPSRVPSDVLPLATIYQTWNAATRYCVPDAVRMVAMNELAVMNRRIETLHAMVGDLRLAINLTQRDPSTKRGLFVDNFQDNDLRDAGLTQNAVIINGSLTLGLTFFPINYTFGSVQTLTETTPSIALQQPLWTGATKINPYLAFAPMPARATLDPAIDLHTEVVESWTDPFTSRVYYVDRGTYDADREYWSSVFLSRDSDPALVDWFDQAHTVVTEQETATSFVATLGETTTVQQYCRAITIGFTIEGFGGGELLNEAKFDGIAVTPRTTE